jgi:hypothetical protein
MQNAAFACAQNDGYTLGIMTAGQIAVMNKSLRWPSEQDFVQPTSDGGRERVMAPQGVCNSPCLGAKIRAGAARLRGYA